MRSDDKTLVVTILRFHSLNPKNVFSHQGLPKASCHEGYSQLYPLNLRSKWFKWEYPGDTIDGRAARLLPNQPATESTTTSDRQARPEFGRFCPSVYQSVSYKNRWNSFLHAQSHIKLIFFTVRLAKLNKYFPLYLILIETFDNWNANETGSSIKKNSTGITKKIKTRNAIAISQIKLDIRKIEIDIKINLF